METKLDINFLQTKMIEADDTIDKLRQGNKKESYMLWLQMLTITEQNNKIIELLESIKKNTTPASAESMEQVAKTTKK